MTTDQHDIAQHTRPRPDPPDGYVTPDGTWHPDPPEPECVDGWLGEDLDGRPVPCPHCRPHLRRITAPDGSRGWTTRPARSHNRLSA